MILDNNNFNKTKYNILNNSSDGNGGINSESNQDDEENQDINQEFIVSFNGIEKRIDQFGLELDDMKKRYYFKFGYQITSHRISTSNLVYDYTFNSNLPDELHGIIDESEYQLVGHYIKMVLARNGSPQMDYFYFSLIYFFYFFIPFIIYVNQDQDSSIYIFYLAFGCIVLLSIFLVYFKPFYKKRDKMYLDIVNILKIKSITLEKTSKKTATKYQLFQFINLASHLVVLVSGVVKMLLSYQNNSTLIYSIYKLFIIIDIPIICYYLYNYILFTEFRNIIPLSKLLDEADYIKMLNKNIYKAIGPLQYYISYPRSIVNNENGFADSNNSNSNSNICNNSNLITISASTFNNNEISNLNNSNN